MFNVTEECFLLRSLREVVMVWKGGTGQASFNLSVKNGSADLQLGFQLGRAQDPHLHQPQHKGEKRRDRDRARAQAHHASKLVAASAPVSTAASAVSTPTTSSTASAVSKAVPASRHANHHHQAAVSAVLQPKQTPGTPVLPPLSSPPPSGTPPPCPPERRATRSTTTLVKMKIAAFARSAAESALLENLPNFIPGFNEKIEYYMKESDFGDGNETKYFNKYTSMYVFGFYCDRKIVTKELLQTITSQWASRDKYWEHRPTGVIEIVL